MKFKKHIILGAFLSLVFGATALASCNSGDEGNNRGPFIDYFNTDETIRLSLDYKKADGSNRNFYTDGISQVELFTHIDGDTSHFKMKDYEDESIIQSRYYGIDTPESTGDIQPYGKAASNFTKEQLTNAKTIVVTSDKTDYGVPQHDSTGSRYVSMIWISEKEDAPIEDLRLLNLAIVQEGLSLSKGLDKFPAFEATFTKAELQARDFKLNMFSGKPDPLFNYGAYETVSLFDIQKAVQDVVEGKIESNPYDNANVRIVGTVCGFANGVLFLQASRINDTTGKTEYAGINVFCGMNSIDPSYTDINTQLRLCGKCIDSEQFGFQVTAVHGGFPLIPPDNDPDIVEIINYPEETIAKGLEIKEFHLESKDLVKDFNYVNLPVYVDEEFTVTGFDNPNNDSKKGGALYIKGANNKQPAYSIYVSFAYTPNIQNDGMSMWTKAEEFMGHTFKFSGVYSIRKTRKGSYVYNILPRNSADIIMIR